MAGLRSALDVQPHLYMGDSTGRPLDYGRVFFGEANKDPEFYPIDIFYDENLTIPASQPVRTKGGFLNANGDMCEIFAKELIYSVKVLDQYGRKVFYKSDMSRSNTTNNISSVLSLTGAINRPLSEKLNDSVSVKDFGAKGDGVTDDSAAFDKASQAAKSVIVPAGNYLVKTKTTGDNVVWDIKAGAVITGLPNAGIVSGGLIDTSNLKGFVINQSTGNGVNGLRIGNPTPFLNKNWRDSAEFWSALLVASPNGTTAATFSTNSGADPSPTMNAICAQFFPINDNIAHPEPTWGTYYETIRKNGAGPGFSTEMDFVNLGDTYLLTPYNTIDPYASNHAPTVHLWLSCGGGDNPNASQANNMSAAICTLPNIKSFHVGWVVRNGSIASAQVILSPEDYRMAWVNANEVHLSHLSDKEHYRAVYTDTQTNASLDVYQKHRADKNTATINGDVINVQQHRSYNGTGDYLGVQTYSLQATDFSNGNALHTYIIKAANGDGGFSDVALNSNAAANFSPFSTDNAIALGSASHRWGAIFAGTGTINTSDERLKTSWASIDESEKQAALKIKSAIKRYKFIDSIDEKGGKARIHWGVGAQTVAKIMSEFGLNACDYGFFCYDEWEAIDEVKDDDGNVIIAKQEAGNRYGIRYDELAMFILASI